MEPIIEDFTIVLKYQVSVNTDTGEMTTKCISRKIDKSNFEVVDVKKSNSNIGEGPRLILESNKYQLTQEAVKLLGVMPDDKIDIKYEKQGKNIVPVIASDEIFKTHSGNKLTKSLTVACRGSKNSELAKFGDEFILVKHPNKEGIFLLKTENEIEPEIEDEENIEFPDLQELIDNEDVNEVTTSIFQL